MTIRRKNLVAMLLDARNPDEVPDRVRSNVVIVGAGTVGLFAAIALARSKIPVILIEAGDRVASTSRNGETATSVGKPHNGALTGRAFGLGGTSVLWGGQLAEFEPADLARHDARWPLDYEELQRWYEHTYDFLNIRNRLSGDKYREKFGGETEQHESIERFFTYWLPHPNFASLFRREITSNPLIRILLNASVNDIAFAGPRAETVRAIVPGVRKILVSGENFIFAAGTIENSRLFLSMQRLSPVPWKTNQYIGTHFQDHLGGKIADVQVLSERAFREFFENGFAANLKLQPKLRFAKRQRERALIGLCGFFTFDSKIGENVGNIKNLIRALKSGLAFSKMVTLPGDISALGRAFVPLVVRYIRDRRVLAFFDRGLEFHVQAEQVPVANSTIRLVGTEVVSDGLFRVEINWQVDGREVEVIRSFARHADEYLQQKGIGRLSISEQFVDGDCSFLSRLSDTYHPCGGLRMANSKGTGVVDSNCRVWGTRNVFVSGASVFPTSSHANCTFTSLALAARLARTIKSLG